MYGPVKQPPVMPRDYHAANFNKTHKAGKRSKWLSHVKKTMRANKGKTFRAVMKLAKKTYGKRI